MGAECSRTASKWRRTRPWPLVPADGSRCLQLERQVVQLLRSCLALFDPDAVVAGPHLPEDDWRIDHRDGCYSDCRAWTEGLGRWRIRFESSHTWGEDLMHPSDQHWTRIWTLEGLPEGQSLLLRHLRAGQLTQAPYQCELVLEICGLDEALAQAIVASFERLVAD